MMNIGTFILPLLGAGVSFDPSLIKLIVNVVLIAFCFLGFLGGVAKGSKKAGIRFIFFAISIALAFALTPVITGLLLQISIPLGGVSTTIKNFLVSKVSELPEVQEILTAAPSVLELIINCVQMLAQIVVFIVLVYLFGFLFWIYYKVTVKIAYKKKGAEIKNDKLAIAEAQKNGGSVPPYLQEKKHRLLGGLVGIVQGFLLLAMTLIPITTACGLVVQLADATEVAADTPATVSTATAELLNTYLGDYLPYFRAFDDSVLSKVSHVGNMDKLLFNSIAKTKVGKEKIVLVNELTRITQIYNDVVYLSGIDFDNISLEDIDPNTIDFARLRNAVSNVFDLGTLRSVGPELIEFGLGKAMLGENSSIEYKDEVNEVIAALMDALENDEETMDILRDDLLCLIDIAQIAVESGLVDEFTAEPISIPNIMEIVVADDYEVITDVVDAFFNAITIRTGIAEGFNAGLSILEKTLLEIMPDDVTSIDLGRVDITTVNWASVKTKVVDFLKSGIAIYDVVKDLDFENMSDNPSDYFDLDYETVIENFMIMLDCIQGTPILNSAENDDDIYGNILQTLEDSNYGKYFYFENINIDNFWTTQADGIIALVDCAKVIMDVDFESPTFSFATLDTQTIGNAIESVFDFGIIANVKPYVWSEIKDMLLDKIEIETMDISAEMKTAIGDIIDSVFETLASGTGAFDIIKDDLSSIFDVFEILAKNGIIDDTIKLIGDIEGKSTQQILTLLSTYGNEVIGVLTANDYEQLDLICSTSLTTVEAIVKDVLNLGLSFGEEKLKNVFEDDTISIGRVEDIDFTTARSELTSIAHLFVDALMQNETPTVYTIDATEYSIHLDIDRVLVNFGKIFDKLVALSVFDYGESSNIITNLLDLLNDEFGIYFDFTLLDNANTFESLFTALDDVINVVLDSSLYNTIKADFNTIDYNNLILQFKETTLIEGVNVTLARQILTPILQNALIGDAMAKNVALLNSGINTLITQLDSTAEECELNGVALNTPSERMVIADIIDNALSLVDSDVLTGFSSGAILETILSMDLSTVGMILDDIKNWGLFADIGETAGAYTSLVNALANMEGIGDIIDVAIMKEETFSFEDDLTYLQNILDILSNVSFIPNGETEAVDGATYLFNTFDYMTVLKYVSLEIVAPAVKSDLQVVFENMYEVKLLRQNIATLTNMVNSSIYHLFSLVPYENLTWGDAFIEQKTEIITTIVKAFDILGSQTLDETTDFAALTEQEAIGIGELINMIRNSKYRNVANPALTNGVFAGSYDIFLAFMDSQSYSYQIAGMINVYANASLANWVDILQLSRILDAGEGYTAELRAAIGDFMYKANGNVEEYRTVAYAVSDFFNGIGETINIDEFMTFLNGSSGLSTLSTLNKTKVDKAIDFLGALTATDYSVIKDFDFYDSDKLVALQKIALIVDSFIDITIANALDSFETIFTTLDSANVSIEDMDATIDFVGLIYGSDALNVLKGLDFGAQATTLDSINTAKDAFISNRNAANFATLVGAMGNSAFICSQLVSIGVVVDDVSGIIVDIDAINAINNLTCDESVKADIRSIFNIAS